MVWVLGIEGDKMVSIMVNDNIIQVWVTLMDCYVNKIILWYSYYNFKLIMIEPKYIVGDIRK